VYFIEVCPTCRKENELETKQGLTRRRCSNCGVLMLPCRLCFDMHEAYNEIFGENIKPNCSECSI